MTTRRHAILHATVSFSGLLTLSAAGAAAPPNAARDDDDIASARRALLAAIPATASGAPATNATLSPTHAARIERLAETLEVLARPTLRNAASDRRLDGAWRLAYSNAPEITTLTTLPLGFRLDAVYQPVDLAGLSFENQAAVGNAAIPFARGSTRVVGDLAAVADNTNRLDVDFRRVIFALESPVRLRRVVAPKRDPAAIRPSITVTYLDDSMRLTRGANGALFVLVRGAASESTAFAPLTRDERAELYAETKRADEVVAGAGLRNWSTTFALGGPRRS